MKDNVNGKKSLKKEKEEEEEEERAVQQCTSMGNGR